VSTAAQRQAKVIIARMVAAIAKINAVRSCFGAPCLSSGAVVAGPRT